MFIRLVVDGESHFFPYDDRAAISFSRVKNHSTDLSMYVENDGRLELGLFEPGESMKQLVKGYWEWWEECPDIGAGLDLYEDDRPECVSCREKIDGAPVCTKIGKLHLKCYREL